MVLLRPDRSQRLLAIKTIGSWLFSNSSEFLTERSLDECATLLAEKHEPRPWLYPVKVQIEPINAQTYIFRIRKEVIFSRGPFPLYSELIGSLEFEEEMTTKVSYETR